MFIVLNWETLALSIPDLCCITQDNLHLVFMRLQIAGADKRNARNVFYHYCF
jgi:hypothetical protein